jgi:C4-dicarboxylate-specific signal transduction histidine kinase
MDFCFILGIFLTDRYQRKRYCKKKELYPGKENLNRPKEIEKAYHKLEQSHENLKATQAQLIQSEKMASLGELTAGIAHEIQKPVKLRQ